jgi:DNA-binding MarR family transcriptional regulator
VETSLAEVGLAVKRLQWRHHRTGSTRLAAIGLSLPQWDVLRHLHENPDASLHALAELTFQTDQSMGALATRMIDRGLLERRPGPGRAVRHRATEDGERVRAAGAELMREVLTETVGTLSEDELRTLHHLLLKAEAGREQLAGAV